MFVVLVLVIVAIVIVIVLLAACSYCHCDCCLKRRASPPTLGGNTQRMGQAGGHTTGGACFLLSALATDSRHSLWAAVGGTLMVRSVL